MKKALCPISIAAIVLVCLAEAISYVLGLFAKPISEIYEIEMQIYAIPTEAKSFNSNLGRVWFNDHDTISEEPIAIFALSIL